MTTRYSSENYWSSPRRRNADVGGSSSPVAANALGVSAANCIGFEGAVAGFKVAGAAGLIEIGIESPGWLDAHRFQANLIIHDDQGLALV